MLWLNKKTIGDGYLTRWHLIPRNRFFNVYLHRFTGNDYERALHDHSWWSLSFRIKGRLREYLKAEPIIINSFETPMLEVRDAPVFCYRPVGFAHRLELIDGRPAWTIFITGPRKREWGFHCRNGWVHWSKITDRSGKTIGGCDE